MWLLSTHRAELRYFVSPEVVPAPGYAILSHVWGNNEQTLQEIQDLCARCATTGENPRDLATEKIRESCQLAEKHGYAWLWVDTCCIDKTSSAELSEAINSMFHYYSAAGICYAYLRDVPSPNHSADFQPGSTTDVFTAFRWSTWHTRGWTLQELVAPEVVLFVSQDWRILFSKADCAELLETVTQIPASVLRLEAPLSDISVAKRMSWAARRRTTRVEDEAYCLLGIFDINMPTLYGEGRRAFQRLQEEILKQTPDTTLFAWGSCCECSELSDDPDIVGESTIVPGKGNSCLFAPSPAAFAVCSDIEFMPQRQGERTEARSTATAEGRTTFSVTPHGVLARVPIIETNGRTFCDLFWSKNGRCLFLVLTPFPHGADPVRLLDYYIGSMCMVAAQNTYMTSFARSVLGPLALTKTDLRIDSGIGDGVIRQPRAIWREVYLAHNSTPHTMASSVPALSIPFNLSFHSPFHFSRASVKEMLRVGGYRLSIASTSFPPLPWSGTPPATLTLKLRTLHSADDHTFVLSLGTCTRVESSPPGSGSGISMGVHWANVRKTTSERGRDNESPSSSHTVPPPNSNHEHEHELTDHILQWPDLARTFDFALPDVEGMRSMRFELTLSFTPHVVNPVRTLALQVTTDLALV